MGGFGLVGCLIIIFPLRYGQYNEGAVKAHGTKSVTNWVLVIPRNKHGERVAYIDEYGKLKNFKRLLWIFKLILECISVDK